MAVNNSQVLSVVVTLKTCSELAARLALLVVVPLLVSPFGGQENPGLVNETPTAARAESALEEVGEPAAPGRESLAVLAGGRCVAPRPVFGSRGFTCF